MRRSLIRVLPLLLLVALGTAGASFGPAAVLAQGPGAHATDSIAASAGVSQYGPAYGPAMPLTVPAQYSAIPVATSGVPAVGLTPDDCAPGDSWCAYCAMHPDSDLCKAFVPPHLVPATSPAASPSPSAAAAAAPSGPTVSVMQSATLGTYLVDAQGMTLYTTSADTSGASTCTGMCATIWPPLLLASGNPTGGSGVTGTLGVITRPDGGRQVTYKGKPLYRYVRDTKPGDTNGNHVTDQWGTWSIVAP